LKTLSPEAYQRSGEILEQYLAELELGRRPDLVRLTAEHLDLAEHLKFYAASLDFLQQAAATKVYAEAIEHQRWALARAPTMLRYREFLAQQYDNYGRVLRTQHRSEEAAQAAVELQKLRLDTAKADPGAVRQP
jgi:phytoene dehydrogenase-like protein